MSGIPRTIVSQPRAVIVGLLLWFAVLSAAQAQEQLPVTVVIAKESEVTERIAVVGSLIARDEVEVHPLIQGQVTETILVESGNHVEKGQALAVLDTTAARMLLDKNSVDILRAKAAVSVEASRLDVARVTEAEAEDSGAQPRSAAPISRLTAKRHGNCTGRPPAAKWRFP